MKVKNHSKVLYRQEPAVCYGIFLQREFPENLAYGIGIYHEGDGSLIAFAPGQIGGKRDDGTRRRRRHFDESRSRPERMDGLLS